MCVAPVMPVYVLNELESEHNMIPVGSGWPPWERAWA